MPLHMSVCLCIKIYVCFSKHFRDDRFVHLITHALKVNVNLPWLPVVPMDRLWHLAAMIAYEYSHGVHGCRPGVKVPPKISIIFTRLHVYFGDVMVQGKY